MILNEDTVDALNEIVNIGVGKAAGSLSELIGAHIQLRVPEVRLVENAEAELECGAGISVVQGFQGSVSGNALLVFPDNSGEKLARLLGGYEPNEAVSEFELSGILSEIGNIVLNGVLGSLANAIEVDLTYRVPEFYLQESLLGLIKACDEDKPKIGPVLIADTEFTADSADIRGSVVIAFHLGALPNLLAHLEAMFDCAPE